jgi:hypothetical protein
MEAGISLRIQNQSSLMPSALTNTLGIVLLIELKDLILILNGLLKQESYFYRQVIIVPILEILKLTKIFGMKNINDVDMECK